MSRVTLRRHVQPVIRFVTQPHHEPRAALAAGLSEAHATARMGAACRLVLEAAGVADAEAVAMRLCRADADAATVVHQLHAYRPEALSPAAWDARVANALRVFARSV